MRIKTIIVSFAFASLCLASNAAFATSIDNSDFSFGNSGFKSEGAYAGAIAWTSPNAASASVALSYEMLTSPASLQPAAKVRPLPASSPLPGAGVVGLIALLALAARRDLLG